MGSYHPLYQRGDGSAHCLSAACWKQNILLLFCGFPSNTEVLLIFQNLSLASSSEPPDTDIVHGFFQSFWPLSVPWSVLSLLLLLLQIPPFWIRISKYICHFSPYQKKNHFSLHVSHFQHSSLSLSWLSLYLTFLYKPFSHCPYESYVTPNFSCLLHLSLSSFPQDTL